MKNAFFKILLALLFVFAVTSCDNSSTSDSGSRITPPTWIHGKWSDGSITFTFTSDNLIMETGASGTVDFKVTFATAEITEPVENDTEYSVKISATGSSATYAFAKISETEISYAGYNGYMKQ